MTIIEQIKILDDKIKQIQADYDLYRQNSKISALSSGKLDIYEYLTGEDLRYDPDPVLKAKLEYSLLGQVFNKGLDSSEKQEGLLKRLKNIEDKTNNQLQANEDQKYNQSVLKPIGYTIRNQLPEKAIKAFNDLVDKEKTINYTRLHYKGCNNNEYDFTIFSSLGELLKQIYYGKLLIPAVEREQDEFYYLLDDLKKYNPRDEKHISAKDKFLKNIQNFYDGREMIIKVFKNKIIPLEDGCYSQYFERKPDKEIGIY